MPPAVACISMPPFIVEHKPPRRAPRGQAPLGATSSGCDVIVNDLDTQLTEETLNQLEIEDVLAQELSLRIL